VAYRGVTVQLPVGASGFTGTRNQSQAGPGHLIFTEGAELDGGIIRKDGGARILNRNSSNLGLYTSHKTILHFDSAVEGDSVIVDSGFLPPTAWEAIGGAGITLLDKKFGTGSLKLNGTTQYLRASDWPGVSVGVQSFTAHCWFNCQAVAGGANRALFGQVDNAGANSSAGFYLRRSNSTNTMQAVLGYNSGNNILSPVGTTVFSDVTNAGWHHAAMVLDTSPVNPILYLFVDGVLEAQSAMGAGLDHTVNNPNTYFMVGALGDTVPFQFWQGGIDELVIVVGKALWTANFTPPVGPTKRGGIGATPPTDTPLPIISGINWSPGIGKNQDVVCLQAGSTGLILSDSLDDGTFATEVNSTMAVTRDPPPYFCVAGGEDVGQPRKLILFNANNLPIVYKGNADPLIAGQGLPISTPPADWTGVGNFPIFGCVHVQRLWAGGNASDPHRLYYSSLTNHEVFTGSGAGAAGTIPIYPGQGERIIGAYSVRGALIIWKYPVGVYVIQTVDPDPTTWSVQVLSRAVGGLNCHTIVQIENDILFMDRNGSIHSLTATNEFGDFNTGNVSQIADMQPFMNSEVNRSMLSRSQSTYYANKRQAWFLVPRTVSDIPNLRIEISMEGVNQSAQNAAGVLPRFFLSRRDEAQALWLRPDKGIPPHPPEDPVGVPGDFILRPTLGEEDGCVYILDQEARNKDGVAYPIQFGTANSDLAFVDPTLATKWKNAEFMEIVYEPEGDWDLTVHTFWDDRYASSIAFNMGGAGVPLDVFELDRDVLGASGVKEVRRRLVGSGRRFRMVAFNDGLNQNVSIAGFHMSFTIGDERTPEGLR
jgi:Concanavalin A-like lectin/glucanases superfamily